MKLNEKLPEIILWAARLIDSIFLIFVSLILLAHVFGSSESGEGFRSASEVIQFVCFPLGLIVGLAIAWKWEGTGGLIATLSMSALFVLRPDLVVSIYMILMILPGLLFILYWFLTNIKARQEQESKTA